MAKYKSIHTGPQIDSGVSKALNPDTTPTAGSDALITSGGTKSAITAASVKYADVRVYFRAQTWAQSAYGKYYIPYANAISVSGVGVDNTIVGFTILNWDSIGANDFIQPYAASGQKLAFMSNTNSFEAESNFLVRVAYI